MKFKIRTKLISAFFAMLVPFFIVFTANYFFAKKIHESIHTSADISYELENLGDLQLALDRLLMPANDYIITADPKERVEFDRLAGEVEKHLALIPMEKRCQQCHQARTAEMIARLYGREASKDMPEEMLILKEIRGKFEGIKKYGEAIFSLQKPVGSAAAARLMKEMDLVGHKVIDGPISRHRQMEKKDMQKADEAAEKSWRRFMLSRTLGYLTAVLIGVVIALIYSGRLAAVIKVLHKGSDSIAGGDLKTRVDIKTGDELEQLSNAMNGMAAQLDTLYSTLEQKVEERTRELKKSEERYCQIIQTSMDGFWLTDTKGRILEVNDVYCQMSGYAREELLNMRIPDLEAKETPEETAQHIQEVMTIGYARFETRHRRKDGQLLDIEASVVHRTDPEDGYFFIFLRDITERKQAEEKIKEQLDYLERFQKVALKREFRIKELRIEAEKLKAEIAELEEKLKKAQGLSV